MGFVWDWLLIVTMYARDRHLWDLGFGLCVALAWSASSDSQDSSLLGALHPRYRPRLDALGLWWSHRHLTPHRGGAWLFLGSPLQRLAANELCKRGKTPRVWGAMLALLTNQPSTNHPSHRRRARRPALGSSSFPTRPSHPNRVLNKRVQYAGLTHPRAGARRPRRSSRTSARPAATARRPPTPPSAPTPSRWSARPRSTSPPPLWLMSIALSTRLSMTFTRQR